MNDTTTHHRWQTGMLALLCICAVCASGSESNAQIPCSYDVQVIPTPPPCIWGPRPISPSGISPNGRYISGSYVQCGEYDEACVFDTQTWQLITIPRPSGVYSAWCNDVNDNGVAVGGCWKSGSSKRGWMYTLPNGPWLELTPVIPTSSGYCEITAINASNVVCGSRSTSTGVNPQNAFTYKNGKYADLGVFNGPSSGATDINDHNAIIGWTGNSNFSPNTRAFIYESDAATVLGPVPDGLNCIPIRLNNSSQLLLGGQLASGQPLNGYVWYGGTFTQLLPMPAYASAFAGTISDSGIAMGGSYTSGTPTVYRACLWQSGKAVDVQAGIQNGENTYLYGVSGARNSDTCYSTGVHMGTAATMLLQPLPPIPGDANCDKMVNVNDLLLVINTWGPCSDCASDFTGDNLVNINDLLIVLANWG